MKQITVFICFLVGSAAFANGGGYDLKMDLSMNGKHVSSPRLIAREGEVASITQNLNGEKIFIEVVATEKPTANNRAILMSFVVGKISATGEKTIVSTPKIIALENDKAEVTVNNDQGKESIALSVTAARKAL